MNPNEKTCPEFSPPTDKASPYYEQASTFFQALQKNMLELLNAKDSQRFQCDPWQHHEGGGGITAVIEQGHVFEKGGVNFSAIHGKALPKAASDFDTQHTLNNAVNLKDPPLRAASPYTATGLSVVLHPYNPYAPTCHANWRFFETTDKQGRPLWWFGGGFDLTPYYGFTEDCKHWHTLAKKACDPYGKDIYPRYKKACDDYFFLAHRNEPRGIGGLFFDNLNHGSFERCFAFIKDTVQAFLQAYLPIVKKRKDLAFGKRQRNFQAYRRGRYVEFNLLYDRGTVFGLKSQGRIESIFMSLPPHRTVEVQLAT